MTKSRLRASSLPPLRRAYCQPLEKANPLLSAPIVLIEAALAFGTRRASIQAWRRMSRRMLRITFEEKNDAVVLKLEGRLAGPWAAELGRLWEEKAGSAARKKVFLDLRETTFADARGVRILKAIHSQTGAKMLTGTPWTQHLAEMVASGNSQQTGAEV